MRLVKSSIKAGEVAQLIKLKGWGSAPQLAAMLPSCNLSTGEAGVERQRGREAEEEAGDP